MLRHGQAGVLIARTGVCRALLLRPGLLARQHAEQHHRREGNQGHHQQRTQHAGERASEAEVRQQRAKAKAEQRATEDALPRAGRCRCARLRRTRCRRSLVGVLHRGRPAEGRRRLAKRATASQALGFSAGHGDGDAEDGDHQCGPKLFHKSSRFERCGMTSAPNVDTGVILSPGGGLKNGIELEINFQ